MQASAAAASWTACQWQVNCSWIRGQLFFFVRVQFNFSLICLSGCVLKSGGEPEESVSELFRRSGLQQRSAVHRDIYGCADAAIPFALGNKTTSTSRFKYNNYSHRVTVADRSFLIQTDLLRRPFHIQVAKSRIK